MTLQPKSIAGRLAFTASDDILTSRPRCCGSSRREPTADAKIKYGNEQLAYEERQVNAGTSGHSIPDSIPLKADSQTGMGVPDTQILASQ